MIRFDGVEFSYGGASRRALAGISLDIGPGESLAVLGPNGSGKSTLALLANGLFLPSVGSVTVDGMCTGDPAATWEIRSRVGVVFQNPDDQIVGTVVEEDVAFGPENLGVPPAELRRRVDEALARTGLAGLERREPHLLSGGQKQRLAIAGVLAFDPAYLVLDEPTAMLDPRGRADVLSVLDRLRADGRGIVHVTHHLADVASADRVLVLVRGEIAFLGTPEALFERHDILAGFGLSLPPVAELVHQLRCLGLPVPATALCAESIVGAL